MLAQPRIYRPVFPSYFSLKELTDLYFDNFAISYVKFSANENNNYFGIYNNGKFTEKMEGKIVIKAWQELPKLYKNCILGDFKITENEFCGIIMIDNRAIWENSRKMIPRFLTTFKNRSTKLLNQFHGKHGRVFWENNYTEKVIENVDSLKLAIDYING